MGTFRIASDLAALCAAAEKGRVRPLAALYTLERLFHVMTEPGLLNPLLAALLGGGASTGAPSLSEFRYNALEVTFMASSDSNMDDVLYTTCLSP